MCKHEPPSSDEGLTQNLRSLILTPLAAQILSAQILAARILAATESPMTAITSLSL
jgi:hypothetical protein